MTCPLTKLAASEARNITTLATSPGVPTRPAGQKRVQNSRSSVASEVMSVSMNPGTTTLLVSPLRPYSRASEPDRPSRPALLAA